MTKWKYESLQWIHDVRERNYERTKNKPMRQVVAESVARSKKTAKKHSS